MKIFELMSEVTKNAFKNCGDTAVNAWKHAGQAVRDAWAYARRIAGKTASAVSGSAKKMWNSVCPSGKSTGKLNFGRMGLRTALTAFAIVLMACSITGGAVAWLSAETPPLTNTFTYGDINLTLTETETDGDDTPFTNTYTMVPGHKISKDPVVTVLKDSESCWLFVKLEKSRNFDDFMEYEIAEGWTKLEGKDGIYYRQVDQTEEDIKYYVLKNNEVKVKDSVTKVMLNKLDENGASDYPTLTIYSYAVQRDSDIDAIDTAEKAWELVENPNA